MIDIKTQPLLKPKKRAGTETVDREMLEAHLHSWSHLEWKFGNDFLFLLRVLCSSSQGLLKIITVKTAQSLLEFTFSKISTGEENSSTYLLQPWVVAYAAMDGGVERLRHNGRSPAQFQFLSYEVISTLAPNV